MKPDVDSFLTQAADTLTEEILPHLSDEYRAGTVSVIALMLKVAAEEYDRAADLRVAENQAIRSLFADAAERIEDEELAARLREAAAGQEASYRIRSLDTSNAALRRLLVELHERVECGSDAASVSLGTAISDLLQRNAELRILTLPTP